MDEFWCWMRVLISWRRRRNYVIFSSDNLFSERICDWRIQDYHSVRPICWVSRWWGCTVLCTFTSSIWGSHFGIDGRTNRLLHSFISKRYTCREGNRHSLLLFGPACEGIGMIFWYYVVGNIMSEPWLARTKYIYLREEVLLGVVLYL